MFEIIAFWIWVTIFTYILLVPAVHGVLSVIRYYIIARLRSSALPAPLRAQTSRSIRTWLNKLYFLSAVQNESREHEFRIFTSYFACLMAWIITLIIITVPESVPSLNHTIIDVISMWSENLATYTSWLVLIVPILLIIHLSLNKLINIYISLSSKLSKLDKLVK